MDRKLLNTLIVNDDDLECRKKEEREKEITLDDIKLSSVGFKAADLEKFDIIVYKGKLGKKALKLKV